MSVSQLPSRFPVSTCFVVEGRRRQGGELCILSRELILPNGKCVDLTAAVDVTISAPRPRAAAARRKVERRRSHAQNA